MSVKIVLAHGRLQDPGFNAFLTNPAPGSRIKAFFFNYNKVYAEKSAVDKESKEVSLDDYVAGLFATMPEGSMLVTLRNYHWLLSHVQRRLPFSIDLPKAKSMIPTQAFMK